MLPGCFEKLKTKFYIDGLCKSLKSICIDLPIKILLQNRLSDIMSEEASSSKDEITRCQCHLSDMEDDDTLSTSQPSYDEGERKLTSLLKKINKKRKG